MSKEDSLKTIALNCVRLTDGITSGEAHYIFDEAVQLLKWHSLVTVKPGCSGFLDHEECDFADSRT
jgi:hypothetical protein